MAYLFPWLPHAVEGFVVLACEEERFLVLGAPAPDGHAIVTWSFVLEPRTDGTTRLIVRSRANAEYGFGRLPPWVVKRLLPPGHFVMQRRQLLGIARRAEQSAETAAAPPSSAKRSSACLNAAASCERSAVSPPMVTATPPAAGVGHYRATVRAALATTCDELTAMAS